MAGQAQKNKDKEMASHLKAQGIFHGKRTTSPSAWLPNPLRPGFTAEAGSAAYRRRIASGRKG